MPKIKPHSSWGPHRGRYSLLAIDFKVTVFGICLVGIEVFLWRQFSGPIPFGLELYLAALGFSVTFMSDESPKIETFNGWKLGNRGIALDIQSEASFLGIYLIGIEVVVFHKPFAYDTFFAIFGFGVSVTSGE